jgi:hypothetical protein
MLEEHGYDITGAGAGYENPVIAVLAHPFHGRLVERPILWVRPSLNMKGERYKLTWWSEGIAYYEPTKA